MGLLQNHVAGESVQSIADTTFPLRGLNSCKAACDRLCQQYSSWSRHDMAQGGTAWPGQVVEILQMFRVESPGWEDEELAASQDHETSNAEEKKALLTASREQARMFTDLPASRRQGTGKLLQTSRYHTNDDGPDLSKKVSFHRRRFI